MTERTAGRHCSFLPSAASAAGAGPGAPAPPASPSPTDAFDAFCRLFLRSSILFTVTIILEVSISCSTSIAFARRRPGSTPADASVDVSAAERATSARGRRDPGGAVRRARGDAP